MFLAGNRSEPVTPDPVPLLQYLYDGVGVALARYFAGEKEGIAALDTGVSVVGKTQLWQGRGQGLVGFVDMLIAKQLLVAGARGFLYSEQHQACGVAIQPVQWLQIRQTGTGNQPRQQGLVDITATGCHRQEVGLIGHQQMLVLI